MKIRISTLVITIEVLLNFSELNAMEGEGSSSGSKKRVRRPGGVFQVTPRGPAPVLLTGPCDTIIKHMGKDIEVWLDEHQNIVQALYPGHSCPHGNDYKFKNFLIRLVVTERKQTFVEYVGQDGALLGVRARRILRGNYLEPDSTQWFIVYMRKYFRVRINPETKVPLKISLATQDESAPPDGEPVDEVDMAGFKFILYVGGPYKQITGAALPPKSQPSSTVNVSRRAPPTVVTNFRDLIS